MATQVRKDSPTVGLIASVFNSLKNFVSASGGLGAPSATTTVGSAAHTHTPGAVSGATDTGAAHTHVIAKLRRHSYIGALAAAGTNYHAQFPGGAAIDEVAPFLAERVPPRTVQIARGGAGAATVYTIDGTDITDTALQEIINSAGAATVQGTRAFKTITRIRSDVDPTVTTDVQTGIGFATSEVWSDLDGVGVDGALEVPTSSHAATGTIVPATAPNAGHVYAVRYRVLPTAATEATHTHAFGTLAVAATGGPSATTTVPTSAHTHASSTTNVHRDATESSLQDATATSTDLATAVLRCNRLRDVYVYHCADTIPHLIADAVNVLALKDPIDLATAILAANELKAAYNLHRSQAGVHPNNDAGHQVTSGDATILADLHTLLNEMSGDINAHLAAGDTAPSIRALDT